MRKVFEELIPYLKKHQSISDIIFQIENIAEGPFKEHMKRKSTSLTAQEFYELVKNISVFCADNKKYEYKKIGFMDDYKYYVKHENMKMVVSVSHGSDTRSSITTLSEKEWNEEVAVQLLEIFPTLK